MDQNSKMSKRASIEVVPCPDCGGMGYTIVTPDMASDAGDPEMTGAHWGCSTCNGCGQLQQEVEEENSHAN